MIIGIGISRTISISNTIKITARRKNRVENGIRAEFRGSNPHSNGDIFSRSFIVRIKITFANSRRTIGIKIEIVDEMNSMFMN